MTTFEGLSPPADLEFRIATGTFDLSFLSHDALGFSVTLALEAGLQALLEVYAPDGALRLQIVRYREGRSPMARVLRDRAGTSRNARPGPFPPGTWSYRLSARNVTSLGETGPHERRWSFALTPVGPGDAVTSPSDAARDAPVAPEAGPVDPLRGTEWGGIRWYAGDLHQHTTLSDGTLDPISLVRANRAQGHAFMSITDHQVLQPRSDLPGLLVLGGTEVTTPHGHFLRIGDEPPAGLLPDAPGEVFGDCADLHRLCTRFHDEGAFLVACHPAFPPWHWRCDPLSGFPFDAVEILCDPTHPRAAAAAEDALRLWNGLLDAGRRTVGVGGSDFHGPPAEPTAAGGPVGRPGDPTTFLAGPPSMEPGQPVPASLREGRVAVGRGFLPGLSAYQEGRERLPGESIALPVGGAAGPIRIRAAIVPLAAGRHGTSFRCTITGSGGTGERFDVRAGSPVDRSFLPPDRAEGWFRLDIRDASDSLCGFTNPIRWRRIQ